MVDVAALPVVREVRAVRALSRRGGGLSFVEINTIIRGVLAAIVLIVTGAAILLARLLPEQWWYIAIMITLFYFAAERNSARGSGGDRR